jgi:uncharacterized protein (DUF1330 family)
LKGPCPMSETPKGYWIAHATVTDQAKYDEYRAGVAAPFEKYGATFLARGGSFDVVEGHAKERHIVVEFPSVEAAKECFHSPEYQAAKAKRKGASENDVIIVEGV